MKLKKIAPTLCALCLTLFSTSSIGQGWNVTASWTLAKGLNKPESVVYDKSNNVLYVSNLNGKAKEKNGLGYIAKVSPDGKIVDKNWISGLNAPKGMALSNGKLYVADIDALVVVDVASAKIEKRFSASGAKFFNDVTIDGKGIVYVSDSKTSKIHSLDRGNLAIWLDDERVRRPNGLYAMSDYLVIAAGDSGNKKPHKNRYLQLVSYDKKNPSS